MTKKLSFISLLLICCVHTFCQQYFKGNKIFFDKDSIASFVLEMPGGGITKLKPSAKELLVLAFLSPECPLCKNYSVKLTGIKNKYAASAEFIGIIPGSFDAADIREFKKDYIPSWQLLRDTSLQLTNYLEGKVTPEVLVIDNKDGKLIYKGAIDDWVVSLGKTRNRFSNFYLDIALKNFLNHKPSIPFTKPVGCLINDF